MLICQCVSPIISLLGVQQATTDGDQLLTAAAVDVTNCTILAPQGMYTVQWRIQDFEMGFQLLAKVPDQFELKTKKKNKKRSSTLMYSFSNV